MAIVVTGASGHLGRSVTASLLADHGVAAADLVLLTRSPDALADVGVRGAQVRHGDFDDPASLPGALAGAEKVLVISTDRVGARVAGHHCSSVGAAAYSSSLTFSPQWGGRVVVVDLVEREVDHEAARRGAVPVVLARLEETRSPGRMSSIGPPRRWQRPTPSVT